MADTEQYNLVFGMDMITIDKETRDRVADRMPYHQGGSAMLITDVDGREFLINLSQIKYIETRERYEEDYGPSE